MTVVLVYQMGKVGSVSIVEALVGGGFRKCSLEDTAGPGASGRVVVHVHSHAAVASFVAGRPGGLRDVRIVTGVRRILDRNVSAFFENADKPGNPQWYLGPREQVLAATVDELITFFRPRNLAHTERVVLPWFRRFGATTGIEVLARPFDRGAGHGVFGGPEARCFVYRQEDLPRVWGDLEQFLGARLKAAGRNAGHRKWYAEKYRAFKEAYRPSHAEWELCERNDLMRHFYGNDVGTGHAWLEPAA